VLLQTPNSLANLMSALRILDAFVTDEARNGQAGYSLVTTQVATDYLLSLNWSDLEFAALAPASSTPSSSSSSSSSSLSALGSAAQRKPRKLTLTLFGRRDTSDTSDEATLVNGERELNVPVSGHQLQSALGGDAAVLLSVQLCSAVLDLCRRFQCFFSGSGKVSRSVRTAMRADSAYAAFVHQTQLLDGVVASELPHSLRVVFWANVYTTLLLHAHLEIAPLMSSDQIGCDVSVVARVTLFRAAAYRVQGLRFSLLDIEHGVLRAPRRRAT
jgi:hypothetical protein